MSTKAAEAKVMQEKARIEVIMRTILISCASHLRSLVIERHYDFDLTSGLPVLPLLRDITIGTVNWYTAADAHTRFPSLRRLHLLSLPRISHSFWLAITKFAPHITHLRLSRITQDTDISRFLRIILDIPRALCQCPGPICFSGACHEFSAETAHASEAITIASRLPNLEFIYVQPGVCAPRPRRTGYFENSQMVEGLEAIASSSARGEGVGRLVLLPPRASYTFEDVRKDWLETVEGKDGAWPRARPGAWSASARAGWPEGHHAYRPGHHPPV
ncbi:hypothetical protein PsYK624_064790 [Phanerochaete sordida]|uniref:F-box domain-containing protein n=1 Tax=Phanerochaete sordida TaxID=48140 RepID=A0A9P3G6T8_9APHY|nr:hypothetical protein PsYK624_064790 [Phanerochaete sordida]